MEFKANSKELEKLLAKIIPAVPTRTPMQILENILLEVENGVLTVYATDLEISLKSFLNIASDENIKIVIPARLFYDIIKSLKDTTVHFKINSNKRLEITTEKGKYTLSYIDADEFPEIPTINTSNDVYEISINGQDLKSAFDKTAFAMSKEEIRPAMMGTLFEFCDEGLRFVTTDGHRLVNYLNKNIKADINKQYVVPERAVSVLSKVLDEKELKVYFTNSYVSFKLNDMELITRLIAQKYPEYKSVIPLENEYALRVKTNELLDSIKRMMLFTTSTTRRVKFSIDSEQIIISAEDIDIGAAGEEEVKCEYRGEKMEIGFNSTYINDILSHLSDYDEIIFKLHSPTKAVIIEPVKQKENTDLMMLLMPVRLNT